jgi:hypothetical protein
MFRKIFTALICFTLVTGVFFPASAADQPAPKAQADNSFKGKLAVAVDIFNRGASLRLWPANNLGIDISAGLNYQSGNSGAFGINLGGNLVFPMLEVDRFALYVTPGLKLNYLKQSVPAGVSTFDFLAGAGLEFEAFIVEKTFSLGGSVGGLLGIRSISPDNGSSSTSFIFCLASDIAVIPLIARFYF